MKKSIIILGLLWISISIVIPQNAFKEIPNLIPPSPQAASLLGYGYNNVNYYTGSVDISIPIYTIKVNNFQLPLSIKYTGANGIKVNEQASWIGLGWSLQYGGHVSRTIRGIADDHPNGYRYHEIKTGFDLDNLMYFQNVGYNCVFLRFRTPNPTLTGHLVLIKSDTLSRAKRTVLSSLLFA